MLINFLIHNLSSNPLSTFSISVLKFDFLSTSFHSDFPLVHIRPVYLHSTMSDSSDDNLSDLEEQQAVGGESDGEEEKKPQVKGICNDVVETEVTWKDLVRF